MSQRRLTEFHRVVALAGALTLASGAAALAAGDNTKIGKKDRQFMEEAVQGDLAEVNMGKLAQQKGQSDAVRQFGRMLEQDHGQHLQQAQQLADQNGIRPPDQPSAKQNAMYQKLSRLDGARFDAAFARAMVEDHEKDVRKYEKEASARSPLAEFAGQTVPTLRKHLDAAKSLKSAASASR